jgi:cbb3-type cytochrome oxidase subunit 3
MHKDLLAHSPLLALPIMAMALFIVVWVATTVRALTRPRAEVDEAARMPLAEDDDGRR